MDVARASDQIDLLIERRVGERTNADELEEMYRESVRRHREKIRQANRAAWHTFYAGLAHNHREIAARNEAKAAALLDDAAPPSPA